MDVPFKILSIDGGGIKGIYSAIILKELQDEFCNGNPISDYFDLICGTSTGGLIALGLSNNVDISKIIDFYENEGENIFPKPKCILTKIKQGFWGGKYDNKILKKCLAQLFQDRRMNDSSNLLCIPSFNLNTNCPKVWKFPHKEGNFSTDGNIKLVDVALATSAAPTYFPAHEIENLGKFIDGGIWANNPTLCGVTEAIKHFLNKNIIQDNSIKFTSIEVLSIGSINEPKGEHFKTKNNRSYLKWGFGQNLIEIMMDASSFGNNHISKEILDGLNNNSCITRIEERQISKSQKKHIDLDLASPDSIKLLKSLAFNKASYLKSSDRHTVKHFFKNKKHYKTH
ncbi:CBASS cGAMP-activated phospholipase [Empedobacter sp. ULE_I145]